jgi:hypothetical protein
LPLLHYAVGSNRLEIVKVFVNLGAVVGPDARGRWPSILLSNASAAMRYAI